jgi:hypothetical protein
MEGDITTALALTACGGQTGSDSDSGKDTPQGVVSQAAAKKIADFTDLGI